MADDCRHRTFIDMIEKIQNLSLYPVGWDGSDAVPPHPQAINDAESFFLKLPLDSIPCPHVSMASDGEINFLWVLPPIHIDLGFYGDGTYSFYALGANGQEYSSDKSPIDQFLPDELLSLLKM